MRRLVILLSGFLILLVALPVLARTAASVQPMVRDPQALALLQNSVMAMANAAPSDSVASGTIAITAGSSSDTGWVKILTRGTGQTAFEVQTSSGSQWSMVYSNGFANKVDSAGNTPVPLEEAITTESFYFPFSAISGILANQDVCYQYIAAETLNESTVQHVRVWNTFNSIPSLQFLSNFSVIDFWFDATSGLPVQVSFVRRTGGGSSPKIPITISYSSYQKFGDVLYPHEIQEFVNGTLWATVTIQSVVFNSGLSDASFPVAEEAN